MSRATATLEQWKAGLISDYEACEALAALEIHGAIYATGFIGYDYINQEWITA